MTERAYLDWNATAPLRPDARAAMLAALDHAGNPSSVHAEGRTARQLIERARRQVAALVGADPDNIVFTSGATEANAMALSPYWSAKPGQPAITRLLVSAVEHPSVLGGGRFGAGVTHTIAVDSQGVVVRDALRALLAGGPAMVSVMLANNETGVIQPICEIAEIVHEAGGLLHVDAVQAPGRISFNFNDLNADLMTLSAHKIGGPKGTGALIRRAGLHLSDPLIGGGGQERGLRGGTENVAGIAGFGAAAAHITSRLGSRKGPRLAAARADRSRAAGRHTRGHHFRRERRSVAEYHVFQPFRAAGRDRRDRLRSGRSCGVIGRCMFLR